MAFENGLIIYIGAYGPFSKFYSWRESMFSARIFVLVISLISLIYDYVLSKIADKQRKRPLPDEVSDIYDKERYQKYLDYVADNKKLANRYKIIDVILLIILVVSPVFAWIEDVCNENTYGIFFVTLLVFWVISTVIGVFQSYESTFKIEEKYGLNKKDKKEFYKDEVLNNGLEFFLLAGMGAIFTYVGEHMAGWTNDFSVGYSKVLYICIGIAIVVIVFIVLAQGISYLLLHKQYTFTPLEEGELKDKINKLQESSKKKVKNIFVYDESKKSTRKNAFLLKLYFVYREFGIADNFINENAEGELLAVLSHEIGHLKHKKNILNFLSYGLWVLEAFAVIYLMANPTVCLAINKWVRDSFDINANNYYMLMTVYLGVIKPLLFCTQIFGNYRIRSEEYEADREAVKNGYGKDLVKTFKALSSDELVNVNPHPVIEFLEYDHPGMYQRIKAINEACEKLS